MPIFCEISTCSTNDTRSLKCEKSLFSFPNEETDQTRFQQWLAATGKTRDKLRKKSRLCEVHFEHESFMTGHIYVNAFQPVHRRLTSNAIPTLFLYNCGIDEPAVKKFKKNEATDEAVSDVAQFSCSTPKKRKLPTFLQNLTPLKKPETLPSTSRTDTIRNLGDDKSLYTAKSTITSSTGMSIAASDLNIIEHSEETGDPAERFETDNSFLLDISLTSNHILDTTWIPEHSDTSDYDTSDDDDTTQDYRDLNTTSSNIKRDVKTCMCLVYYNQLKLLFNFCQVCGQVVTEISPPIILGSMITIKTTCLVGHEFIWNSQPQERKQPIGNVAITSALMLTGMNISAFVKFCKTLGLQSICYSSINILTRKYVYPNVIQTYLQERKKILQKEIEKGVVRLMGDGQYDSPGFCANLLTYTALSIDSQKIVDFVVIKKGMTPGDLEKVGCNVVVGRLSKQLKNKLKLFLTDRHRGIALLMRTSFVNITHEFDVWHLGKNLMKRFTAVAKKKENETLLQWKQALNSHLWWCVANCKEDGELLVEMFTSFLYHIRGVHEWSDGTKYHRCSHDLRDADEEEETMYLNEDDQEFKAVSQIVTTKNFLKDLKQARHNCHTGPLELFHALKLAYLPKRVSFTLDGTIVRTMLAVMDHNSNTGRKVVGSQNVYSKVSSDYVWKNVYEKKSDGWRMQLQEKIIHIENTPKIQSYEKEFQKLFRPYDDPISSAPKPKPSKEEALKCRRSRFQLQQ